jgi:hypothetical protein
MKNIVPMLLMVASIYACGNDGQDQKYDSEGNCLSCDVAQPEEEDHVYQTEGWYALSNDEMAFLCTNDVTKCDDTQSIFVLNHTSFPIIVNKPFISRNEASVCGGYYAFTVLPTDNKFPYILKAKEFLEIKVKFTWSNELKSGILNVQINNMEILQADLFGKLFLFNQEQP